jgi:hypothetical protein
VYSEQPGGRLHIGFAFTSTTASGSAAVSNFINGAGQCAGTFNGNFGVAVQQLST